MAKKLEAKEDALDAERGKVKVNKAIAGFRNFATTEQTALKTERERIIQAERDLKDSLTKEQEGIKRDREAFAKSEVAKNYAGNQEHWKKYFPQIIQEASYPQAVRDAARRHLDHFNATGDLLPDRPVPQMDPKIWEGAVNDNNKWNREFKEGKKRLDERVARLKSRAESEGNKLNQQAEAYAKRLKALEKKKNAIDDQIKRFNDASTTLEREMGQFQKKRRELTEKLITVRAGDKLIRECTAVYERTDPKNGGNWRADYDGVLEVTELNK